MAFYAGQIMRNPAMQNPTIVVLTDRNDLDDQLFGTFSALPRTAAANAGAGREPRATCATAAHGRLRRRGLHHHPEVPARREGRPIPVLSERRNIVVIADEAHRSQYDFIDGFARHMRDALPNASFIGFTGTPIEKTDANTRAVFGDYIGVYDIQRAVEDKATVPIYYESRLAKLELPEAREAQDRRRVRGGHRRRGGRTKEKLKSKWAALEAIVGDREAARADRRRPRGALREAAGRDGRQGDDRLHEPPHLRGALQRDRRSCGRTGTTRTTTQGVSQDRDDRLGRRPARVAAAHPQQARAGRHWRSGSRKPKDPFKLVIVRDMWLTGFDAPSLHTMYVDKPMRGHGLMQAIARVNRVFRDKPGGLVVDYIGLAARTQAGPRDLHRERRAGRTALRSGRGRRGHAGKDEICCGHLPRIRLVSMAQLALASERRCAVPDGAGTHPRQEDGKQRFISGGQLICQQPSLWLCRTKRRSGFATTSASSRPSEPR